MTEQISELIGVYDADSTLMGEISYWVGARLGTTHCSLCELTHGIFTQKNEWKDCSRSLSVPFHTFHRNDAPTDVREAACGSFPLVLARTENKLIVILSKDEVESFAGSTPQFIQWIRNFLETSAA